MDIQLDIKDICAEALYETAVQLKAEIVLAEVIPKNEGTLETSHHVKHPEARRAEIAADEPYARRLYNHPEYNFRRGNGENENANAKGEWFEDWQPGGKLERRAAEIYKEKLEKKLGGG